MTDNKSESQLSPTLTVTARSNNDNTQYIKSAFHRVHNNNNNNSSNSRKMEALPARAHEDVIDTGEIDNLPSPTHVHITERSFSARKHAPSALKFGIDSILASQRISKSSAGNNAKDFHEIRRTIDLAKNGTSPHGNHVAAAAAAAVTLASPSSLLGLTPPSPSSPTSAVPSVVSGVPESPSLYSSLYNYWSMFPYLGAGEAFSALVHQREAMLKLSTVSDITKQTALPPAVTASMMDYYTHLQAAPLRSKRLWKRTVYTPEQKRYLESQFQAQKFVDVFERRRLAFVLGLTDENVKVWFQNRRKRWRRALMQGEGTLKTLDSLEDYRKFQAQRNSVDPEDMEDVMEEEDDENEAE